MESLTVAMLYIFVMLSNFSIISFILMIFLDAFEIKKVPSYLFCMSGVVLGISLFSIFIIIWRCL